MADITLMDEDWEPYNNPIQLQRNITIEGFSTDPSNWTVLDLNFLKRKVLLDRRVTLEFRNLVLYRAREAPIFMAPGIDLIARGSIPAAYEPKSSWPLLIVTEGLSIQRTCLPKTYQAASASTVPRPDVDPGNNSARFYLDQDGCLNCSTARPTDRCWPMVGSYDEMSTIAIDLNDKKMAVPAGYIIMVRGGRYACMTFMTMDCVHSWGSIGGCYFNMFPNTSVDPPLWGSRTDVITEEPNCVPQRARDAELSSGRASGTSGGDDSKLAVILGGVPGGVVLLAAIGGAVAAVRIRRRRKSGDGCCRGATRDVEAAATSPVCRPARVLLPTTETAEVVAKAVAAQEPWAEQAGDRAKDPEARPEGSMLLTGSSAAVASGSVGAAAASSQAEPWLPRLDGPDDPADRELVPVTPLTPLLPGINLDLRPGDGEVRLSAVTLGKGAVGRVVEGTYGGRRVAVKVIDHGLGPFQLDGFDGAGKDAGHDRTAGAVTGAVEPKTTATTVAAATADSGVASQEPPQAASRADSMLQQEIAVLARCQHPNIVQLLAACITPPRYCLVMELMDTSLDRMLYDRSPPKLLPLDTVLHIAIQIARGLAYLHPTITHRDLKPANVLVSGPEQPRPVAKLGDFGLSRLNQSMFLDTHNPVVGTAAYIAPEAFENLGITNKVDIFALGIILWEMLSGLRPWDGLSMAAIAVNVTMYHRRLPVDILTPSRCPAKLLTIMTACWDPEPARRPAAADLVKALALVQQQKH